MDFNKLYDIVRMRKLSGLSEVVASDIHAISEEAVNLNEEELTTLPSWQKTLIEGKVHVMDFDNKFVLKPVSTDVEDKSTPSLNKTKDYEKDGGDAKKKNKKMVDNELTEGEEEEEISYSFEKDEEGNFFIYEGSSINENHKEVIDVAYSEEDALRKLEELSEQPGPPYTEDQVKNAKKILRWKRSKLDTAKEPKTRREKDDAEYEELMRKKKEKEEGNPDRFIKSNLKLEAKNNAEDATVYAKTEFDPEDEQDYYGKSEVRSVNVKKPKGLLQDIKKRIKEIEKSIEMYDEKGYNDGDGVNSIKNKAIECLEQIRDNLKGGTYEDYKQAQQFFLTLMNPIQALIPTSVVNFLSGSLAGDEPSDEITQEVEPYEDKLQESSEEKETVVEDHGPKKYDQSNTAVETWFERDRAYVGLYPQNDEGGPDTNQEAIVEWWDDDVYQMVEDGFLSPRDWHGSALEYARHVGLVESRRSISELLNRRRYSPVFEERKNIKRVSKKEWYDLGGFETTGLFRKDRGKGWEYYIDLDLYSDKKDKKDK